MQVQLQTQIHKRHGGSAGNLQAIQMDGVDDYIEVGHAALFDGGNGTADNALSVEAWIKTNDVSSFRVMCKWTGTGAGQAEYALFVNGSDELTCRLYDNVNSVRIGQKSSSTMTTYETSWTHVAFTYDASETEGGINLYVNGSPFASVADSAGVYTAMHGLVLPLYFGHQPFGGGADYANGTIDEIRIWNVERSAAQILANYNKDLVGNETNLIGLWKFESVTNATINDVDAMIDSTSNNNHGKGNNFAGTGNSKVTTDAPTLL